MCTITVCIGLTGGEGKYAGGQNVYKVFKTETAPVKKETLP